MAALFKRLFDIERHELVRALLMFFYGFLLLSAYLILKPVRNSLFLDKFGADQLIYMYMIIAAVATPAAWIYGRAAARMTLPNLVGFTTIFLVLNMAAFWWLIQQHYDWLIYVFYVWVSLFGVFTTSQYWLLANYVFDAREAKRVFAFIGAGSIIGGMTGSFLTGQLAELVGTENLLWLCMAAMLICFGLLVAVWKLRKGDDPKQSKRKKKSKQLKGILPIIRKSRHLRLLAIMIGLTVMVSTFVDFQFNKVVGKAFEDRDTLTAFFGWFFLALSIASLLLQLLFSSRIIRRFGVGVGILFLPTGLLLGSSAIFLWPVLASAIVVKISDGSFRYSINKTGLELLYLPVPTAIKGRVKAFMDVVGDRFARGIGGLLLYVVNDSLHWPVQWISFLSSALIALWIAVAVMLKREYSRAFRATLSARSIDSAGVQLRLQDAASIEAIALTLKTGDRRQILFALELLVDQKDDRLVEPLGALLNHESPEVRRKALQLLVPLHSEQHTATVEGLLHDPAPEVRSEAVRFMCEHASEDSRGLLRSYLTSDDTLLVSAATRCALEYKADGGAEPLLSKEHFERALSHDGETAAQSRRQLAEALRFVDRTHPLAQYCTDLLDDTDLAVRKAALRSAGTLRNECDLPKIIDCLGVPALRSSAAGALLSYGPAILERLSSVMMDDSRPAALRLRVPKVISQMDTDEAAHVLFARVEAEEALLRYVIIKGLNRMRRLRGEVPLERDRVHELFLSEARSYYTLLHYEQTLGDADATNRSDQLAVRSLKDSRRRHLDQAFRLAGLIYGMNDMRYAFRGVVSSSRVARSRAVEFLDTVWEHEEKQLFFPILEASEDMLDAGRRMLGLEPVTAEQAVRELLQRPDQWLAACIVNAISPRRLDLFVDEFERLSSSKHRVLSDTAKRALARLKASD